MYHLWINQTNGKKIPYAIDGRGIIRAIWTGLIRVLWNFGCRDWFGIHLGYFNVKEDNIRERLATMKIFE